MQAQQGRESARPTISKRSANDHDMMQTNAIPRVLAPLRTLVAPSPRRSPSCATTNCLPARRRSLRRSRNRVWRVLDRTAERPVNRRVEGSTTITSARGRAIKTCDWRAYRLCRFARNQRRAKCTRPYVGTTVQTLLLATASESPLVCTTRSSMDCLPPGYNCRRPVRSWMRRPDRASRARSIFSTRRSRNCARLSFLWVDRRGEPLVHHRFITLARTSCRRGGRIALLLGRFASFGQDGR